MAFVRNKKLSSVSINTATLEVVLPEFEDGDLLLIFVVADGNRTLSISSGWTENESGNNISAIGYGIFYIENATGSIGNPIITLSANDTATAVAISVGGVPTTNVIEASTSASLLAPNRSELNFSGITTLSDDALVLHLVGNSATGGMASDVGLRRISDEIGYIGESAFMYEETVPTAGSSSTGKFIQSTNTNGLYKAISIKDGSSGTKKRAYQVSGGLELINGMQGLLDSTWRVGGSIPSDVTEEADYGTISGKTFRALEGIATTGDANTVPFMSAARFKIDRGPYYSGLKILMDRYGSGGTKDISNNNVALAVTMHQLSLNNLVKLQTKAELGYSIALEDNTGNYVIHAISGSDSTSPKISPVDQPCLVQASTPNPISSSGVFDSSNLTKVAFMASSLNATNLSIYFCNVGILSAIQLAGGSSLLPINQEFIYEVSYANLGYFIKNIGNSIISYTPWIFGNGTEDTYVDFQDKTISFPEHSANTGALVGDDFFGLRIESSANSDFNFTGSIISSAAPFYLNIINGLGNINFTNSTISGTKVCNLRGNFTGSSITPQSGSFVDDFDATILNININGDLRLNSVRDLTNVTASKIVVQDAGTYNFTNVTIDEIENISGGVVNIVSDKSIATQTNTSGTLNVQDSFLSFSGVDSWNIYASASDRDANTNSIANGTGSDVYRFTFVASTTYYLRLTVSGETLFKESTPTQAGETSVSLNTASLLNSVNASLSYIQRNVYVDTSLSENGTGSATSKYNNIDDAVTLYKQGGYIEIILTSSSTNVATLGVNADHVIINGTSQDSYLNINGQSLQGSTIKNVSLYGSQDLNNTTSYFIDCGIVGNSDFVGKLENCGFYGDGTNPLTVSLHGSVELLECRSSSVQDTNFDFTNALGVISHDWKGGQHKIDNLTGSKLYTLYADRGECVINASSTGGFVTVNDMVVTTDNGTSTVLNSNTTEVKSDTIIEDTNELQTNQGQWVTATGFATPTNVSNAQTAIIAEVQQSEADVIAALPTPDEMTEAELHSALDSYANKDNWKADVSSLSADVNVVEVNGVAITSINDFKADISNLALEATVNALNNLSSADITSAVPTTTQIATAVEAALIDEGDGQQLIDAILQVINSNLDLPALELTAIAQAVRTELTTELNDIILAKDHAAAANIQTKQV